MNKKFGVFSIALMLTLASCSNSAPASNLGEANRIEVTRLVTVEVTRLVGSPASSSNTTASQKCPKENPCKVGDSFTYNHYSGLISVAVVKFEPSLAKLMPETSKSSPTYNHVSLIYLKMTCEEPKGETCFLIPPQDEFLNSQEVLGHGLSFMGIMSNSPNKETLNWFQMKTGAFKGTSTEGWLHYGLADANLTKSGVLLRFIPEKNSADPSKTQYFYFLLN